MRSRALMRRANRRLGAVSCWSTHSTDPLRGVYFHLSLYNRHHISIPWASFFIILTTVIHRVNHRPGAALPECSPNTDLLPGICPNLWLHHRRHIPCAPSFMSLTTLTGRVNHRPGAAPLGATVARNQSVMFII